MTSLKNPSYPMLRMFLSLVSHQVWPILISVSCRPFLQLSFGSLQGPYFGNILFGFLAVFLSFGVMLELVSKQFVCEVGVGLCLSLLAYPRSKRQRDSHSPSAPNLTIIAGWHRENGENGERFWNSSVLLSNFLTIQ